MCLTTQALTPAQEALLTSEAYFVQNSYNRLIRQMSWCVCNLLTAPALPTRRFRNEHATIQCPVSNPGLCHVSDELVPEHASRQVHIPTEHHIVTGIKAAHGGPQSHAVHSLKYKKTIASLSPSPPSHCSLNHHFLLTGPILQLANLKKFSDLQSN